VADVYFFSRLIQGKSEIHHMFVPFFVMSDNFLLGGCCDMHVECEISTLMRNIVVDR